MDKKTRGKCMNLKLLGSRILVEVGEVKEEKTPGGIIIPILAKRKLSQEGEVIAVGKGNRNKKGELIPVKLKVGDKVLFPRYFGTEVKIEGKKYFIMDEDSVLGNLEV